MEECETNTLIIFHYTFKFVAYYGDTMQAILLKNLISNLHAIDSITDPLRIYCDNKSTLLFSWNNKCTSESKY